MQPNDVNLGIIGAGKIGVLHAKNALLYTNAKVSAVADIYEAAAENLTKQIGAKKTYTSYSDLIKDKSVDAVIISLPNNLHYEVALTAIENRKHVFCEKPLCLTTKEAEDIVRRVEKNKVKFMVGFNRRFDPSYEKGKKLIDEGYVGKVLIAHSNTFDPQPHGGWEANEEISGGILFTTCSHDFDLLYWLIGSEVRRVYIESMGNFGKDENITCILLFKNDVIATIKTVETCPYGHDVKTEIVGNKGTIRIEKPYSTSIKIMDKTGVHNDYPYWFMDRFKESYMNEIQEFVKCIQVDAEPKVNVIDGAYNVKVLEAALYSKREKIPVNIG